MKTADQWFSEYSADHQNKTNQIIHLFCVPAIVFSLLGILYMLPRPWSPTIGLGWHHVLIIGATTFYMRLDRKLAFIILGFALASSVFIGVMFVLGLPVAQLCIALFALAWIAQFIGHKIEGKKPSFLTDLAYLLIGPLWVVKKVFKA